MPCLRTWKNICTLIILFSLTFEFSVVCFAFRSIYYYYVIESRQYWWESLCVASKPSYLFSQLHKIQGLQCLCTYHGNNTSLLYSYSSKVETDFFWILLMTRNECFDMRFADNVNESRRVLFSPDVHVWSTWYVLSFISKVDKRSNIKETFPHQICMLFLNKSDVNVKTTAFVFVKPTLFSKKKQSNLNKIRKLE